SMGAWPLAPREVPGYSRCCRDRPAASCCFYCTGVTGMLGAGSRKRACPRLMGRSGRRSKPRRYGDSFLLFRPERSCCLAQNLLAHPFAHRQRFEFLKIPFYVRNTRTRPVRAKQRFVGDLIEAREILEQRLRRNAADVEIDVRVPSNEEKRGLHPQRPPAMGQQDFELGEINGHIVHMDWVAVFVARTGENRRSGVKH